MRNAALFVAIVVALTAVFLVRISILGGAGDVVETPAPELASEIDFDPERAVADGKTSGSGEEASDTGFDPERAVTDRETSVPGGEASDQMVDEMADKMAYSVYYHNGGIRSDIGPERSVAVERTLSACVAHVNDRLRLYVDAEDMASVLVTEEAWEVVYDEPQTAAFGPYGKAVFTRLVVPLSGRLGPRSSSDVLTLAAGSPDGAWALWLCAGVDRSALQAEASTS